MRARLAGAADCAPRGQGRPQTLRWGARAVQACRPCCPPVVPGATTRSMRALLGHSGKARWAEAGLLAVHIGGYLTAVFVVLSPLQAAVFLVVQQGLFGVYLESSFAPNHKGMPVLGKDEKVDFLRRQVLTSRNIRGGLLTDLAPWRA